jgi:type II secretory pathway component GspD/PulD (secretin)
MRVSMVKWSAVVLFMACIVSFFYVSRYANAVDGQMILAQETLPEGAVEFGPVLKKPGEPETEPQNTDTRKSIKEERDRRRRELMQPQSTGPKPEQPVEKQPAVQQPSPAPAPPQPVVQPMVKDGQVSFNFDDADVFSVIQTVFGDILAVNYVIDQRVTGRVNFRSVAPIKKSDVIKVMEVILRLNGIGIVEEAGLYRIVPISDLPSEPSPVGVGRAPEGIKVTGTSLVQVVPVHYIESSEMVRVLQPFASKNAVLVDVPKSNYIIIVDTDANVKRLLKMVEIFDSEELRGITPQVYVYRVQNSKAEDIADLLQQIFTGDSPTRPGSGAAKQTIKNPRAAGLERNKEVKTRTEPLALQGGTTALVSESVKIIPDKVTNSIIILATPEDYGRIMQTIEQIDIVPRQVLIEALIARVDLTDDLSFGIQWKIKNDVSVEPFKNTIDLSGDLDLITPIENANFTYTALDAAGNIKLLLQSLAEEGKATVMASPHIMVSDNRDARIQVGQQVPIPTSETNVEGTTDIQRTFQYKDLGIILEVTPQVNESGLVALELRQEVSSSTISDVAIAAGATPVLNKTETTTNLVARDGETIIIGGLIREDASKGSQGVPFLHKIPILGYLFGSKTRDIARIELIVLLTPHVIKSVDAARDVTSDFIERYESTDKDYDLKKDWIMTDEGPEKGKNMKPEGKRDTP